MYVWLDCLCMCIGVLINHGPSRTDQFSKKTSQSAPYGFPIACPHMPIPRPDLLFHPCEAPLGTMEISGCLLCTWHGTDSIDTKEPSWSLLVNSWQFPAHSPMDVPNWSKMGTQIIRAESVNHYQSTIAYTPDHYQLIPNPAFRAPMGMGLVLTRGTLGRQVRHMGTQPGLITCRNWGPNSTSEEPRPTSGHRHPPMVSLVDTRCIHALWRIPMDEHWGWPCMDKQYV